MDLSLALVVLAVAVVAAALILALRRGAGSARLEDRLTQLTEAQERAQERLGERLQAQERELTKSLDARLQHVTSRVNETLEKTGHQHKTTLDELKERLVRIDAAQQNITELSSQVVGLQDVLANKQARGAFGEIQLKDLVEAVLPPSAYSFQATLANGRRVDCLLELPNPPGSISIDAKFPLEPYHALRAAEDEAQTKAAGRAFATAVNTHVRDIAEKYIVPGETAESALMFLPSEAVYAELHANFGDVVEKSYRARVFIVSPTTLWATLNTVRAVLKDVRMREAAGVIQLEVQTMLEDVTRLDKRVEALQRHFDQAERDVKDIRVSADKVTKRGERIVDLQLAEESVTELPVAEPPGQAAD